MALGRVKWLAGRMPLSCPNPVDSPEPGQAQPRARSQARREYGNQHTFSCEQWF
jgi:hypothetical protein